MERKKVIEIPIVKKPSLPDTFKSIPVGQTAVFTSKEIGPQITVYSAIRRLNEKEPGSFELETPDNYATIYVTRNK